MNTGKTVSTQARIAIGIGANLGNAASAVEQAIRTLKDHEAISGVTASSLYRSKPIDSSGPDYINAVITARTVLSPAQTLKAIQAIETIAGRERPYKNAPRTLDLDLLLYDSVQMDTSLLTLPHPRMHLRAFVLVPLAEIAPEIEIPAFGRVADLLESVVDQTVTVVK
jgi:2-amino-4-hydroxy-6-hydroxymethyldihydropteridine diphosphokinase